MLGRLAGLCWIAAEERENLGDEVVVGERCSEEEERTENLDGCMS